VRIISGTAEVSAKQYSLNFIREREVSLTWTLAAEYHLFTTACRNTAEQNPTLLVATIDEPAIMLGRFQHAQSALKESAWEQYPVLRRLSGGPAIFMDRGSVFMSLIIPNFNHHLKPQTLRNLPKNLNDIMLSALRAEGLSLSLAASDVLTKRGYEIGGLGFEIHNDVAVWECWLGVNAPVALPLTLSNYPPLSEDAFNRNSEAITKIVEDLTLPDWGLSFVEIIPYKFKSADMAAAEYDWRWLDRERINGLMDRVTVPALDPLTGFSLSRVIEDYIGFVQAACITNEAGILQEVKVFGDFLADSDGIRDLEEKLRWSPVKKRPIALTIDDILGSQSHVILGLKRLGSILEAIMDAATRES